MREKYQILIVDDNITNIDILKNTLKDKYSLSAAKNGKKAIKIANKLKPDLILLDIMMPEMDGFEVCETLKSQEETKNIMVIFITAINDTKDVTRAFEIGAVDYITKPFNVLEVLSRVENHLALYSYKSELENLVKERTVELEKSNKELRRSKMEVIEKLGKAGEFKDNETGKHVTRVSLYAEEIAKELKIPYDKVVCLELASMMHDIGKIGIPDQILLKPGRLTEAEFNIMKNHCDIGSIILRNKTSSDLYETMTNFEINTGQECLIEMAGNVAAFHHEKWDGSGYPNGLKGEEIPLEARVVALADVYDALSTKRPYKEPFPQEKCLKIIKQSSGTHFDPKIVDAFFNRLNRIEIIKNEYAE